MHCLMNCVRREGEMKAKNEKIEKEEKEEEDSDNDEARQQRSQLQTQIHRSVICVWCVPKSLRRTWKRGKAKCIHLPIR